MTLVLKEAPDFTADAVTAELKFEEVKLSSYRGKYTILLFYPLDQTFVCPTELLAFSDRVDEFRAIGCEVLGVSVDSKFSHLAWMKQPQADGGIGGLQFTLVADLTKEISKAYGVLVPEQGVALRGLFIISDKGIVRSCTINDFPVGRSVDECLRLVQAFQFTDKHGEVCPAKWKPGGKTMKPDVDKSKEYFAAAAAEGSGSNNKKRRKD